MMVFRFKSGALVLACAAILASLGFGQALQPGSKGGGETPDSENSSDQRSPEQRAPATLNGTVVDESGAAVAGATVKYSSADHARQNIRDTVSGSDGEFFFPSVVPGSFQLTVTAPGFSTQTYSGNVQAGEVETLPEIALNIADAFTEVQVSLSPVEVAEQQIKLEEKQRVLGAIPNFYVSYDPEAVPLDAQQKFKLAFRTMVDPFTFFIAGAVAGIEQAQNHFIEYGQGTQGYAKRFGASYADAATGTFIGAAILPTLLKQDPRYLYAIANAVICKGDNKRWQVNYSNILGSLAAGGISNLYYPKDDRNGLGLTFENAALGVGATAIQNLFQEFFVKRLTPKRDIPAAGQ
jgi:hypothetical protein